MIRAVVLDIGSVLEIIDDSVFPEPFETRHGLEPGAVLAAGAALPGDAVTGQVTEVEITECWQRQLGLTAEQTEELVGAYWTWYVGTLDRHLVEWFATQRPARLTGILSNSGPGARERERCWGFEQITDDIVYSHEVGLAKPDPRIFELTARVDWTSHRARSCSSTTSRAMWLPPERRAGTGSCTRRPVPRWPRWSGSSAPRHDGSQAAWLPGRTTGWQSQDSPHARKVWTPWPQRGHGRSCDRWTVLVWTVSHMGVTSSR